MLRMAPMLSSQRAAERMVRRRSARNSAAESAMASGPRPRSARRSPRSPCSMNLSGRPRFLTALASNPCSIRYSFTPEPNPPATALSSTVTMTESCAAKRSSTAVSSAFTNHFRFSDGKRFELGVLCHAQAFTAREAHRDRARAVVDQRLRHVTKLVLVLGRHDDEVRNQSQITQVEGAVVRRTVLAGDAAAVENETHRKILDGDVVDHLVVRALQESGIDGDHGNDVARGQP